jgi:methylmalonyl-CoA carboxyltransferase large subunit
VALSLTDFIVMTVLVGAGCGLSYVGLWTMLRLAGAERQRTTDLQLSALTGELKALEARVAELSKAPATDSVAEMKVEPVAAKPAAHRESEEITPEMLVVMAAAVTAFLGKKIRIRSAKVLQQPREAANSWSQQGRMLVHASHNLRMKG